MSEKQYGLDSIAFQANQIWKTVSNEIINSKNAKNFYTQNKETVLQFIFLLPIL